VPESAPATRPAGASPAPRAATPSATAALAQSPTAAQPAAAVARAFAGDWMAFVEAEALTGMAGLLARHAELASHEGNHFQLVLPEASRMYSEKLYQDKLKAELAQRFGSGVRVSVRVGPTSGASVAAVRNTDAQKRLESATQSIETDPFVRELVDGMGAQVVPSSIRPAGEAPVEITETRRGKP
jgi:DNA polymerase-3 subunit gamma/tau